MIGLLAFTFGPAAILRWWHPGSEAFAQTVTIAATALGALLAPMAMLAIAMLDSMAGLNPLLLVASILRAPFPYLAAAAIFEILTLAYFEAGAALDWLLPVPVLPVVISVFVNLYLTLAGMRILGLFYRAQAENLGWFARK